MKNIAVFVSVSAVGSIDLSLSGLVDVHGSSVSTVEGKVGVERLVTPVSAVFGSVSTVKGSEEARYYSTMRF